jgi:hypothetical protein
VAQAGAELGYESETAFILGISKVRWQAARNVAKNARCEKGLIGAPTGFK